MKLFEVLEPLQLMTGLGNPSSPYALAAPLVHFYFDRAIVLVLRKVNKST